MKIGNNFIWYKVVWMGIWIIPLAISCFVTWVLIFIAGGYEDARDFWRYMF